ncbi:deaminase [Paenibacillus selenitireducens]|uniref:Deaminase n=1 Tax=Paenibacillus selenitireducens TaxID=1324314 RepID=A0A1T2X4K9_9BACL|nr:amidohydrolase [Paenibacillus selenitireducens]OPA74790.1 deaminase [Paenibacillus selenitireducens]
MNSSYWLTNVTLEQGYLVENEQIVGTKTAVYHLRIDQGKINDIVQGNLPMASNAPRYDARELLLLPSFEEGHIHLDKTYYSGPWKAVKPIQSIFDRIEEEKELLPRILPQSREQAERILSLIQGFGTTHVRTHCNIEPTSGLHRLAATKEALRTFSGKLSSEIVAFPQHGLLHSDAVQLVREAMDEGATLVGGLDPFTVDGDIERSLQVMVEIAVEKNSGIDIHLHEGGESGKLTIARLADLTEEAGLQGKVTVSHAFWFASAQPEEAEELAERMASLRMSVASSVPIGRNPMPLPMLKKKGVGVTLGTDSLTDHWSPFGLGDQLEKVGRLAELNRYNDEFSLSQALGYITGGITPLDHEGNQVWPKVGDRANFVLVQASCAAETVARRSTRQAVWYQGNLVRGSL